MTITVLMAVHNGEPFLERSVESIRQQTRSDFEFIIVDDASTDGTSRFLAAAATEDARISVIRNARNLGLTRSLNIGLRTAAGDYIARIDADDVAAPQRLEIQADFLRSHPDHVLVGSRERVIDTKGHALRLGRGSLDDAPFRYLSYFAPPLVHSSAMFRHATVRKHHLTYDEGCRTAQDFEFWQRLLRFGKGCRLADVLVDLRTHERSISRAQRTEQADTAIAISAGALKRDFPQIDADRLAQLAAFYVTGRVSAGIIATALEVETCFANLWGASRHDRREIRALTVNRILNGAVRMARAPSPEVVSGLACLFCKGPVVFSRELISVSRRRRT